MAFSTCSFHHQVSRRQWLGRVVPHISVVLSRPVLMLFQISSVAASATPAHAHTCGLKTSWKKLLMMVFKLPTLRWGMSLSLIFGGTSILIPDTRSYVAGLLPRQGSLLHLWQVCAWSVGKRWSLSAWLPFWTWTWWDGCHVSWNMCSLEAGWMLGHTLGFYHPQHVVLACCIPCHHALPYIQCLHDLHGHSKLLMGSKIQILGSWHSQHPANQRIHP